LVTGAQPRESPPPPQTRPDRFRPIQWLPVLAVLFLVAVLALRLITDFDLGFHLRGGQWMLQHMAFHRHDVFTYTVNHNEYIALYWLFQIIIYVIYAATGFAGLSVLTAVFAVLTFYLMSVRMAKNGLPPGPAAVILLAAALAMEIRFTLRPEIITWIYLVLTLMILDDYFYRRRQRLFWLPVIMLLWTNTHGLFILGWFVIAAYNLSALVHERKFDRTLLGWSATAILASLLNPYFLKGIAFPFYLFTRLESSSVFKNVIIEFKSPWSVRATAEAPFFPAGSLYLYYFMTFASLAGLLATAKKRRLHEFLIGLGFFYVSFAAIRNVPLFIIVAAQIIASSVHDLAAAVRSRLKPGRWPRFAGPVLAGVFTACTILLGLRVITNAYYVADRRQIEFGVGLDKHAHPVAAAEFLVRNNLQGRILNDLNRGSWFIWSLPQPVFIDGRLEVMKEELFREYLGSFSPGGLAALIDKYRPQIIAFDFFASGAWHQQLRRMPDWRLIYWDETTCLWAHRDYTPELPAVPLINTVARLGIDTVLTGNGIWATLRKPSLPWFVRWGEGFYRKQPFPYELVRMGIFAYESDDFRVAGLLLLDFLQKTDGRLYDTYFNLGTLFFQVGDYPKALYCFERVLTESPGNTLARKRIREIKSR
jgi:hypothetical protein